MDFKRIPLTCIAQRVDYRIIVKSCGCYTAVENSTQGRTAEAEKLCQEAMEIYTVYNEKSGGKYTDKLELTKEFLQRIKKVEFPT